MSDARDELIAGRFRILDVLGRGGQGAVYRAEMIGPHGFRRVVAVKRFANAGSSVASLVDEARLASMIDHPNVVQTLEIVEDERELAIVMEYVDGVSLSRLMFKRTGPAERVPLPIVLAVVSAALRGLHAVHEARGPDGNALGIVHRDISPANIMIDRHGVAKVLDFGIAKAEGRSQEVTKVGRIKGKLGYVAPEQIHGNVDRTADIWAAGVVLWEAVCGRRLFGGRTANRVLKQVLAESVTIPPDLDEELTATLDRALDRDPAGRFATAAEMADTLDAQGPASQQEVASYVAQFLPTESPTRARVVAPASETIPETGWTSTLTRLIRSPRTWTGTALVCLASAVATWAWLQTDAPPPTIAIEPRAASSKPPPKRAPAGTQSAPSQDSNAPPPETAGSLLPSAAREPTPVKPARRRAKKRRRSRTAETRKAVDRVDAEPKPNCSVPWTYVDGVKKWKRECF